MVEVKKCMDTYALIEIAEGNPKFAEYLKNEFVISEITLAEFYYVLLRDKSEEIAEQWYRQFEPYCAPVKMDILKEAMKFKRKYTRQDVSFFDAVSYIFSLKNGYLFVTGDKEFEKITGVEFKKK